MRKQEGWKRRGKKKTRGESWRVEIVEGVKWEVGGSSIRLNNSSHFHE